jgi:hypothetical protein
MLPKKYACMHLILLVILVTSCSTPPASQVPTATWPVQIDTEAPTPSPSPTLEPTSTPAPLPQEAKLKPAPDVRAYPGPEHYAGDVLTFEIPSDNGAFEDVTVAMTLDDGDPVEVSGTSSWSGVLLPLALDTTDLAGEHTVTFQSTEDHVHAGYTFEVLPQSSDLRTKRARNGPPSRPTAASFITSPIPRPRAISISSQNISSRQPRILRLRCRKPPVRKWMSTSWIASGETVGSAATGNW